jgi:hypothetical protein
MRGWYLGEQQKCGYVLHGQTVSLPVCVSGYHQSPCSILFLGNLGGLDSSNQTRVARLHPCKLMAVVDTRRNRCVEQGPVCG